ncbi:substrate-binding domain-containing protein [Thalassotalea sp. PP2-459]|uniref:substrate-binding domain-containing protein n=1 Tax=Thalassotalea sp. PP2-459 TaxID=1742724 RepID=UPI0020CA19B9|nr:substrate-binding domain-containing protein [Thalassotalea sp. PP2-459]
MKIAKWYHYSRMSSITIKALVIISTTIALPGYSNNIQVLEHTQPSKNVTMTSAQITALKNKSLTAALVWHGSSPWVNAVTAGAKKTFEQLGIKVLAVTDAQLDTAKQVADIENVSALEPDIVLSLAIDGVSAKTSYQKLVAGKAKLVLLSNPVPDFVLGEDYVGIVTDDMVGMGKAAAELMATATQSHGEIAMIYHDANYFITNNRDRAFKQELANFPNLKIIAEKGFVSEHETSNIAAALLLQHPNLKAIYVSWDTPAEGVIEALRAQGRRDVKVVSHDLGVSNLVDMAMSGNMHGVVSDRPFTIGATMAKLGALAHLGQKAAPYTLVPFDKVTKANIADIWQRAFSQPLPNTLTRALAQ